MTKISELQPLVEVYKNAAFGTDKTCLPAIIDFVGKVIQAYGDACPTELINLHHEVQAARSGGRMRNRAA